MSTKINPAEAEMLIWQESNELHRTNQLLEKRVKAGTDALKLTNEQLEKEILERIKTEKKLQNRITFDHILTTISTQFINSALDEIDADINQALEKIGLFTQYDRSYIYLFEENGHALKNTHEWCGPKSFTGLEDFKTLPAELFQNWLSQLIRQESIHIQDIGDAEQETSNENKLLALQGVRSAYIIPLVYGKETIGYFGLDSCQPTKSWQEENTDSLKVLGNIFVNALMRKNSEEKIVVERTFAQQIMTTMGQGLMMATVEGVFEYVNPTYARMLGYRPEELVGKTALEFTYPEDQPSLIQAHMQCLEGETNSYETRLIKVDGSPLYVLVTSVPNYNHQGKIVGLITTVTDLTERRHHEVQIETKAEEVEATYQAAIQLFKPGNVQELAQQIVSIVTDQLGFDNCGVLFLEDPLEFSNDCMNLLTEEHNNYLTWLARSGRYANSTPAKIPVTGDGLIAMAVRQGEIIYSPDVAQDPRYLPDSTYTQSELVIPLRAYNLIIGAIDIQSPHKNGLDDRAQRIITVFAEHAGLALETIRLYDKLQDHTHQLENQIRERNKAEKKLHKRSNELNITNAKLAKALRTKDEFLANMSHELRTPLNAILGKTETLMEGIHGEVTEKQVASLQVVEESGRHLLELINDILDLAKIEAGKITLDIQPVAVNRLCESSLQFVRQMAHKKQVKLQAHIDHKLKTCQADERRLKQVLINLLNNAVKFTPSGGEVGLNVSNDPKEETVQFQVWDTGIGISQEEMPQLFRPFVQLDSSLARSHEGTGLGLSLIYRLTEMHGGSISLESEIGVGSCFTVTLPQQPIVDSALLKEQAKTDWLKYGNLLTSTLPTSPAKGPLILLVEDNETNVETFSDYLQIWGYRLMVARSGVEALACVDKELPNLILMDVQLPDMDGLTAVRQLRTIETFKEIPIIVLTALKMLGDEERCLAAGANEYLSKPVQLRQLVMSIDQLLTETQLS